MRLFEPMLLEECACQMVHGEESASVSAPHLATISSLSEVLMSMAVAKMQRKCFIMWPKCHDEQGLDVLFRHG